MRDRVTLAGGSYIEYEYDDLNRLTSEAKYDSYGNVIYSNTYEFDAVGNRLKLTKLVPGDLEEKSFEDNFNRRKLGENWEIKDGRWRIAGKRRLIGYTRKDAILLYSGKQDILNPEIEVDVKPLTCLFNAHGNKLAALMFSYADSSGYYAGMKAEHEKHWKKKLIWKHKKIKSRWFRHRWIRHPVWVKVPYYKRYAVWEIGEYNNDEWAPLASFKENLESYRRGFNMRVNVEENKVTLYANNIEKVAYNGSVPAGSIGLGITRNRLPSVTFFDNFKVKWVEGTGTQEEVVNYAYNNENQLLNANDTIYDYDDNGNLTRKSATEGATDYSWDHENRLVGIDYPDGSSDIYSYDGVGKRIQTSEDGNVTNYLYDSLNVIIEQDISGMSTANYVRGLSYGGGIGSIISADESYYYYDGIGNVVNIADNSGVVMQEFVYDAYGNILNGAAPSPHGFSTKEYSSRSGLIHFGARLYDPTVGRFISKDPLTWGPDDPRILMTSGHSLNPLIKYVVLAVGAKNPQLQHPYVYCRNNPINLIDPWGLCEKSARDKWKEHRDRVRRILRGLGLLPKLPKSPLAGATGDASGAIDDLDVIDEAGYGNKDTKASFLSFDPFDESTWSENR